MNALINFSLGMLKIFISYRHQDSGNIYIDEIAKKLRGHYGNNSVFRDSDNLSAGDNLPERITSAVSECGVLILVIGPNWSTERLYKSKDYVRQELELAIAYKKRIIPVTVNGAVWPPIDKLPESLSGLETLLSHDLNDQSGHWETDLDQLIKYIDKIFGSCSCPPIDDCPYCGIWPFKEKDARFFFGRTEFIDQQLKPAILNKNQLPFISLFGATGTGKSSVVFAGLVPELKLKCWECKNLYPNEDPFHSLATALIPLIYPKCKDDDLLKEKAHSLADSLKNKNALSNSFNEIRKNNRNSKFLIIIDKFEEIYKTDLDSINTGFDFLTCLLNGIKWLKENVHSCRIVILTISTSSGHDKTLSFSKYTELIKLTQIGLGGLNESQLRDVITQPAALKQVKFEDGLVDEIMEDAEKEPGVLPLLGSTLRQLWSKKINNKITSEAYREIGGIKNALLNLANDCVNSLDAKDKAIARQIFIQLIDAREPVINTEKIYLKEVPIEELGKEEKMKVANLLAKKRLLVISRGRENQEVIEIAHKSLINFWPQISEWINDDHNIRSTIKALNDRANKWKEQGRQPRLLDSEGALEATEDFIDKNKDDFRITDLAKEFHAKGIEREKRRKKSIWALSLLTTFLFIVISFSIAKQIELNTQRITAEIKHQKAEIDRQKAEIKRQKAEIETKKKQELLNTTIKNAYLSSGEKAHFKPNNREKRIGNLLFKENDFLGAKEYFNDSLESDPDDPETLIYLNNSNALIHKEYLTIAVSVPIKNSNDIAQEMLRGVAQAQHEINTKGGINGKLLHVIIADDDNKRENVRQIANYLVNQDEVIAVIGSNISDVSQVAANIYQDKLVMISPTSWALNFKKIKKGSSNKNYIAAMSSYKPFISRLIGHIKESIDNPVIFVCDDSEAFDQKWFRNFFNGNEIRVVGMQENNGNLKCNFSDLKQHDNNIFKNVLEEYGANSLFIAPHVSRIKEAINFIRSAEHFNDSFKIFGSPTLYNEATLENGDFFKGMVMAVQWHPNAFPEHPYYNNAVKLWGNKSENGITWRTAASYDAANIIINIPD